MSKAVDRPEVIRSALALRAIKNWNEIVGESMAEKSWPDRFDGHVLWVACTGSAWAQELRMKKESILIKLNEFCDQDKLFSDVRFGVRPLKKQIIETQLVETSSELQLLTIREIARKRLENWSK